MNARTSPHTHTPRYYYFTEVELCSSLNSLNWIVWSPAHYSSFFLFFTVLFSRSLVMSAWICCCCCWCCLSCWLTHTVVSSKNARPSRFEYVCLVSARLLLNAVLLMKNDTLSEKCLTETCNQQLRTSETSICFCCVRCTNNEVYFVHIYFFWLWSFFRFGYFYFFPFFFLTYFELEHHDDDDDYDDIQREEKKLYSSLCFILIFHLFYLCVARLTIFFSYHNLFQHFFLLLLLLLLLTLVMSFFFFLSV